MVASLNNQTCRRWRHHRTTPARSRDCTRLCESLVRRRRARMLTTRWRATSRSRQRQRPVTGWWFDRRGRCCRCCWMSAVGGCLVTTCSAQWGRRLQTTTQLALTWRPLTHTTRNTCPLIQLQRTTSHISGENKGKQWRKPGPQFGGTKKKLPSRKFRNLGDVPQIQKVQRAAIFNEQNRLNKSVKNFVKSRPVILLLASQSRSLVSHLASHLPFLSCSFSFNASICNYIF